MAVFVDVEVRERGPNWEVKPGCAAPQSNLQTVRREGEVELCKSPANYTAPLFGHTSCWWCCFPPVLLSLPNSARGRAIKKQSYDTCHRR